MTRLLALLIAAFATSAGAADFTFQFVNDTQRPLSLKLFSKGESHRQWPARTKSYTVRPDAAVQELKIDCDEGEQICWGAWVGVAAASGTIGGSHQRGGGGGKQVAGAGERGLEACTDCCHVCKGGAKAPVAKLTEADFVSR